jgi:hypothetical protein
VTTDLNTLLTALYVKIDDHLGRRIRTGRPPKLSEAELLSLAGAQVLSEARCLRFVPRHLPGAFRYQPGQSGYSKRLRSAVPLIKRLIRVLADATDLWTDPVWVDPGGVRSLPADGQALEPGRLGWLPWRCYARPTATASHAPASTCSNSSARSSSRSLQRLCPSCEPDCGAGDRQGQRHLGRSRCCMHGPTEAAPRTDPRNGWARRWARRPGLQRANAASLRQRVAPDDTRLSASLLGDQRAALPIRRVVGPADVATA